MKYPPAAAIHGGVERRIEHLCRNGQHRRDVANSSYEAVQREGWSPAPGAYVQYLGGNTLDASLLVMPLVKFAGPFP